MVVYLSWYTGHWLHFSLFSCHSPIDEKDDDDDPFNDDNDDDDYDDDDDDNGDDNDNVDDDYSVDGKGISVIRWSGL